MYSPPHNHCLHSTFSHNILKKWSSVDEINNYNLMYPIFVTDEDNNAKIPISSLPDQYRWGINRINELLDPLINDGLNSVLIFGVLSDEKMKDSNGSYATNAQSPAAQAITVIKKLYPTLCIAVDVCLCAYTDHGHCGILYENGNINNQESINRLSEIALYYAKCGAHIIAPSDMMDGRIGAIKHKLHQNDFGGKVSVMSYAAKFASCFYGPFRDAAKSSMKFGDRSFYQLPPLSRNLAIEAVKRDLDEGADMVMVKPGGPYMDIIRDTANLSTKPVAVYQVSGEYAMLYHAAKAGAFDLKGAVMEYINGFKRAGACIIITYYTPLVLKWIKEQSA